MPRLISLRPRLIVTHCFPPLERLLLSVATVLTGRLWEARVNYGRRETAIVSLPFDATALFERNFSFEDRRSVWKNFRVFVGKKILDVFFQSIRVNKILRDLKWTNKSHEYNTLWIIKQLCNVDRCFFQKCANKFFRSPRELWKLGNKIEMKAWWTVKSTTPTPSSFHLLPEMCEKRYHVISQNEVRTNGKRRQREITKVA